MHSNKRAAYDLNIRSGVCKIIFATVFLLRHIRDKHGFVSLSRFVAEIHTIRDEHSQHVSILRSYVKYMVPSLLDLISNVLYLVAIRLATPCLHVATLIRVSIVQSPSKRTLTLPKIPMIAVIHHYSIRQQRDWRYWVSLAALTVGLVLTEIPPGFSSWIGSISELSLTLENAKQQLVAGLIAMVVAILASATSA
jgi:hypothetical protein